MTQYDYNVKTCKLAKCSIVNIFYKKWELERKCAKYIAIQRTVM